MRYLIFIFLVVISYNCKNNKVETEIDPTIEALILDQGNPWLVNNETHIGVTNINALIADFNKSKDKDYTNLGELLSKQTSYIIKKCSMKGKPHDQLHIVLVPMLDEISILRESDDISIKKIALLKLQIYIDKYFEHFTIE